MLNFGWNWFGRNTVDALKAKLVDVTDETAASFRRRALDMPRRRSVEDVDYETKRALMVSEQVPPDVMAEWLRDEDFRRYVEARGRH
ncbi:hypothetical protein [Propylenella binzhouense]|uniref:Uncharacterized protein n=1 Tax=Propylenella binzhouense TaxID=2555902 RepID=A0A964T6A2_9HYPH|nr:hypothetical protein [Propylenella binzhouense]MYZ48910.1 hypothetical protein [Propylenella binzhouense]